MSFSTPSPAIALLSALLLGLLGCSQSAEPPATKAKPRVKEHLVEVATVTLDSLSISSVYTGSLRSRRTVRIFSQEEGRVTELPFYEGDQVKDGDVLLRLDDALLRAELDKTLATRRQAEMDLKRLSGLKRRQLVSEDEIARAATAVEVAKAEETVLKTRLGYTDVRAPFDGVVSARLVEPGDIVSRYTHVLTLTDPTSLITELSVSELILPHLSLGNEVTVRIDALGDKAFAGTVLRIHPELDQRTRHGRVEVVLKPVPEKAQAGQFVRVTFEVDTPKARIVPFLALRRDRDSEFVYVLDPDRHARRTPVRSGRRLADRVEILKGLEAGEDVVVRGFLGLTDGMKVKPLLSDVRRDSQHNSEGGTES